MFRTIVVPLDRSAFAEWALPYALEVARATGAGVRLALVHYLPPWGSAENMPASIYEEAEEQIRESESSYLNELAGRLARDTSIDVRAHMLDGPVAPTLRAFAEEAHSDLIVMSTHGHGGLKRAWLGSVTDALLRQVAVPLLLVRPPEDLGVGNHRSAEPRDTPEVEPPTPEPAAEAAGVAGASKRLTHMLIAVDGSTIADEASHRAGELATRCEAKATLLRVVHPPLHVTSSFLPHVVRLNREELERREAEATVQIEQLAGTLREHGLRAGERLVVDFHPAEAILREATDLGADVIAVGTHGRGGVRRLVLGSVADKVIRGSSLPVFVLPAHAVETAEHTPEQEEERAVTMI